MKGLKKAALNYAIIVVIIITIITSLSENILTSLLVGFIFGISLIITDYLFNINKRITDVLLILVGSSAFSLYNFILYKDIDIFRITCFIILTTFIFIFSKNKRKPKQ